MRKMFLLAGMAVAMCATNVVLADDSHDGHSDNSVNVTFNGTSTYGGTVGMTLSGDLHFQDGSSSRNGYAGQLNNTVDGAAFKTYATEITQWAGSGEFQVIDLAQFSTDSEDDESQAGEEKADAIYRLYNSTNRSDDINTNAKAIAFQAVIWEIIYDYDGESASDISLTKGNLAMTGVDSTLFNLYKGFATSSASEDIHVIVISNEDNQDQILSVPLPGAAAMAGLGLLGLTTRRRR